MSEDLLQFPTNNDTTIDKVVLTSSQIAALYNAEPGCDVNSTDVKVWVFQQAIASGFTGVVFDSDNNATLATGHTTPAAPEKKAKSTSSTSGARTPGKPFINLDQ